MNVNKLKGKIVEKQYTISKLADELGINRSTFYRKINKNGDTLTIKEVNMICKILELTNEEAIEIFFNKKVA